MAFAALVTTMFVWVFPAISILGFEQSEKTGNGLEIEGNTVRLLGNKGVIKSGRNC